MPKELTVDQAISEMASHSETIDASALQVISDCSLGDNIRQGDIFLTCIESLPKGKPSQVRQLAPGTTQGSRHILFGEVQIVEHEQPVLNGKGEAINSVLVGPAFKVLCDKGGVEHPEHGDFQLPKGSCWQATYQQAYADEVRRIQD